MARQTDIELLDDGGFKILRVCEARDKKHSEPRDITATLPQYLPFANAYTERYAGSNFIGMKTQEITLKSGEVYGASGGKRLIYEVGCDSVIYLNVDSTANTNFHYFLQPTEAFLWDISGRYLASEIYQRTAPIVTIAKYEMYFLLGFFSAASIAALVIITGTDITLSTISGKEKYKAAKQLSVDISTENENIHAYAPILHGKLDEFINQESKFKWDKHLNQLPTTIVTDEKTQGVLAGVMMGKATISPNAFTGWTALFTVLVTVLTKSITKLPEAYGQVLLNEYNPILSQLLQTNWDNPNEMLNAGNKLVQIMTNSSVMIDPLEAIQIIREIQTHPHAVRQSIINLDKSFKEFERAIQ